MPKMARAALACNHLACNFFIIINIIKKRTGGDNPLQFTSELVHELKELASFALQLIASISVRDRTSVRSQALNQLPQRSSTALFLVSGTNRRLRHALRKTS